VVVAGLEVEEARLLEQPIGIEKRATIAATATNSLKWLIIVTPHDRKRTLMSTREYITISGKSICQTLANR
jgi:hypothetical protein